MIHPLFSVLIANYNNGRFLQQAIESVLAQTYRNWEVIIVDDASSDNSFDIYDKYKDDNRFIFSFNEKNEGCGYTKRRCVELANGEICGFLDPDDALTVNALEIMIGEHLAHPSASLIHSDHYECDEKLTIISTYRGEQIPPNDCFLRFQHGVSHFATFKRELYTQTIGINPCMTCAVDMDLYYLLDEVGSFVYTPNILYYYRTGTGLNISLGENRYKAFAWDTISQYNAALRRKWDIDKVFCPIVVSSLKYITGIVCEERVHQKEISIRRSKTYMIGRLFTRPLKWIAERIKCSNY